MKKLDYLIIAFLALVNADFRAQNCSTVSAFPFKQTFEDNSASRSCGSQEVIGGQHPDYDGWIYTAGSMGGVDYNIIKAHSGLLNACSQAGFDSTGVRIRLISPMMDVTGLQTPSVSFFMGYKSWCLYQNTLNDNASP